MHALDQEYRKEAERPHRHAALWRFRDRPRESKMMLGLWGNGPSRSYGDIDLGPDAMRQLSESELRWFDHYLRHDDNGIDREPPVKIFFTTEAHRALIT